MYLAHGAQQTLATVFGPMTHHAHLKDTSIRGEMYEIGESQLKRRCVRVEIY